MYVDGSSNLIGSCVELILASPKGNVVEYALWFELSTTNNEGEYEALIIGLKMVKELGAHCLKVCSDLQLVVDQVCSEYEAQEENIMKYLKMSRTSPHILKVLTSSKSLGSRTCE